VELVVGCKIDHATIIHARIFVLALLKIQPQIFVHMFMYILTILLVTT
jgi:hypothetical protein